MKPDLITLLYDIRNGINARCCVSLRVCDDDKHNADTQHVIVVNIDRPAPLELEYPVAVRRIYYHHDTIATPIIASVNNAIRDKYTELE